jgi:hypothetical protein
LAWGSMLQGAKEYLLLWVHSNVNS